MMKAIISFVAGVMLWGMAMSGMAQTERKFIREGNDFFEKQDFEKAEVEYRKASDKRAESFEAAFNMADALYKQKKYEEALSQFTALAKKETDKERLGEIYHNIGNTLLAMQKTDESIEAYKESLRNRPASEPTKYNLEFARQKQQQEQNKDQQNQDKNQDKNQDQDQNQDKEEQDQDKENQNQDQGKDQDKKDQQEQNKDQQNQDKKDQQGQQQEQPSKISKEDAERLLEALQNDEKKVQEKVQKQKVQEQKAKKMKIEKDW